MQKFWVWFKAQSQKGQLLSFGASVAKVARAPHSRPQSSSPTTTNSIRNFIIILQKVNGLPSGILVSSTSKTDLHNMALDVESDISPKTVQGITLKAIKYIKSYWIKISGVPFNRFCRRRYLFSPKIKIRSVIFVINFHD